MRKYILKEEAKPKQNHRNNEKGFIAKTDVQIFLYKLKRIK